jgi:hypothetical protein
VRLPFGSGSIDLAPAWRLESWNRAVRDGEVDAAPTPLLPTRAAMTGKPQASLVIHEWAGDACPALDDEMKLVLDELAGRGSAFRLLAHGAVSLGGRSGVQAVVELAVGPGRAVLQHHVLCCDVPRRLTREGLPFDGGGARACHVVASAWVGDTAARSEIPATVLSFVL